MLIVLAKAKVGADAMAAATAAALGSAAWAATLNNSEINTKLRMAAS